MSLFSDLDLDGQAPVRARPDVGEWGPREMAGTARKKRQRVWVGVAFVVAVALIVAVGAYWFTMLWGG